MCAVLKRRVQRQTLKKETQALTVLTVPAHVLPWAVAGIVGNQICANSPILAWFPFAFVNICKKEKRGIHLFEADT